MYSPISKLILQSRSEDDLLSSFTSHVSSLSFHTPCAIDLPNDKVPFLLDFLDLLPHSLKLLEPKPEAFVAVADGAHTTTIMTVIDLEDSVIPTGGSVVSSWILHIIFSVFTLFCPAVFFDGAHQTTLCPEVFCF